MKRTLTFLIALIVVTVTPSWAATTWKVNISGGPTGSFLAAGDNTTGNGTYATPYLTIVKALSVATAGDTIDVSNGTTVENSGSGYLDITKAITIEADASTLATGKPVIQGSSAAAARVINANISGAIALNNLVIDAASGTSKGGITNSTNLTCTNCDWKNLAGSNLGIGNGVNAVIVLDKCTFTSGNGNSSSSAFVSIFNNGISCTIKGCTVSGVGSFFTTSSSTATTTLVRCMASSDGTRNTISNITTHVVRLSTNALQTNIDIEYCDFSGTLGTDAGVVGTNNSATENITAETVKYCTFALGTVVGVQFSGTLGSGEIAYNAFTGSNSFVYSHSRRVANLVIHDNTGTSTNATADPMLIASGSTGIQYYNNVITIAGTTTSGHAVIMGVDGQNSNNSNVAAATGSINLGDTVAHTYFYQPVTGPAFTYGSAIYSSFRVQLIAVGNPTGTLTGYLYNDNAGVPGSIVDTSDSGTTPGVGGFVCSTSVLSSTPTWFEFWLPSHSTETDSTKYHLVLKYVGTVDGTNYIGIKSNAAAPTNATESTPGYSQDGVSWNVSSGNWAMYQLMQGAFELTDPIIRNNSINCTIAGSAPGIHMYMLGATLGGKIYNNIDFAGSISAIGKLVDGSNTVSHPAVIYNNLSFQGNALNNSRQVFRDKGCRNLNIYQNTAVANGNGTSNLIQIDSDFEATNTPQWNGQPAINSTARNNISYGNNGTGTVYNYYLGAPHQATLGDAFVRISNITIDYDLMYSGTNFTAMSYFPTASTGATYNFAQMQAAGFNVHGLNADPLLANEATPTKAADFRPPYNSPALGMGTNLSAIISPYTDYLGVSYIAGAPTVGALNALFRTTTTARSLTTSRTLTTSRSLTTARTVISAH